MLLKGTRRRAVQTGTVCTWRGSVINPYEHRCPRLFFFYRIRSWCWLAFILFTCAVYNWEVHNLQRRCGPGCLSVGRRSTRILTMVSGNVVRLKKTSPHARHVSRYRVALLWSYHKQREAFFLSQERERSRPSIFPSFIYYAVASAIFLWFSNYINTRQLDHLPRISS